MKTYKSSFAIASVTFMIIGISGASLGAHPLHDVDLAITHSEITNRPAILVAWRNTLKIFEAEILVRNLGKSPGAGYVTLEIVDENGMVLIRRPDKDRGILVRVPARDNGGKDGVVVQVLGSKEANALLDQLDRQKRRYSIRAKVDPIEGDINSLNNISVKSYNAASRIRPNENYFFPYTFTNKEKVPVRLEIKMVDNTIPRDWKFSSVPVSDRQFVIAPGGSINGYATVRSAGHIVSGQEFGVQIKAINVSQGTVFDAREWYLAVDDLPPVISGIRIRTEPSTGIIYVESVVADATSGVLEASGVKLEYSTDGGITFSNKVMAYLDGNFKKPTRFLADLGPFAHGAKVDLWISAEDSVGNITRQRLETVHIPPRS